MVKINGDHIKKRRQELNLTQQNVADMVLSSKQVISNLERGFTKNVSTYMLRSLSFALKCSEDYITGSSSDPAKSQDGLLKVYYRVPNSIPLEQLVQNIHDNLTEALDKLDTDSCESALDILTLLVEYINDLTKISKEKNNVIKKILKILIDS